MKRNYDFPKAAVIKEPIKSKSQVDNALNEQKTLTSIRLDSEIITVAKQKAQDEGVGYLTWLNKKLRSAVPGEALFRRPRKETRKSCLQKKTSRVLADERFGGTNDLPTTHQRTGG